MSASQVILQPACAGSRCGSSSGGCGTCNSSPCCCPGNPSTPTPYYGCAPQCTENHCETIVYNYFATAICTQYAANMPGCGETVTLYFPNVKILTVGSFLWNTDIGYLEVQSFNPQTGQAVLINNCNDGNASIGDAIAACTCFDVVDPPTADNDPTDFPFVAIDFVAPNNGDCITINVTSVNGLSEGGKIAIGTGFYILDSILNPDQIRICNEGEGITPGTTVVAKNDAGQYQYPITSVQTNPCAEDAEEEATVVGCVDGLLVPLETPVLGDALVVSGVSDNLSQFVTLGFDAQDTLGAGVDTTINAGASYVGTVITHTVTNSHPYKAMKVNVTVSLTFSVAPLGVTNGAVGLDYKVENQVNGGGYIEMKHNSCAVIVILDSPDLFLEVGGQQLVCHGIYTIGPSSSSTINWKYTIEADNTNDHPAAIQDAVLQVTTFGVAV